MRIRPLAAAIFAAIGFDHGCAPASAESICRSVVKADAWTPRLMEFAARTPAAGSRTPAASAAFAALGAGAGFDSPSRLLQPVRASVPAAKPAPGPSPAVKALIERVEKEGKAGQDPETGETVKALPPVIQIEPGGQVIRVAVIKGRERGGRFVGSGIFVMEASMKASVDQISADSRRVTEHQRMVLLAADMKGRALQKSFSEALHVDVLTRSELPVDSARKAEYERETAAVLEAAGVDDRKSLLLEILSRGEEGRTADGQAVCAIELEGPESDDKVVSYTAALEGERGLQGFKPQGMIIVRSESTGEASEDNAASAGRQTQVSYRSDLDGALTRAVSFTKDHKLTAAEGEGQADAAAQREFDELAAKLSRP